MDDESKRMHVDSLNVQVSNHQSLKDCLPIIKHAGSSGNGFPYAPEDFPSPGDVWTWRVGKRYTHAGFWQDRSVHPPDRLQSSTGVKMSFRGRASLEQYIRKTFPSADVDAFFGSFVWKIPCTNVAKDASLQAIKSKGCSKSATAIIRPGNCKASNEMCRIKAETGSSLTPATCNICCSEPNFCRYCCCILCSKTIDWIYDGYSLIKCEALVDEKFICGHVTHIECALRACLAGKVGGSIDLDAQYYCRCCDNKTDLLLHVEKIIKVSESIDNMDDMVKVLNLGFCMLRGSEKERAKKLRNHIATSIEKLKHGLPSEDIWKKRSEISELEQGTPMGRTYYDDFHHYGGRGSSHDFSRYLPPKESSAERESREAREDREYYAREDRRAHDRGDRHNQSRRDDDFHKRKSEESRHMSHEIEDSSKRPKIGQPSSSDIPTSSVPTSSVSVEIPSGSPSLPKADIQTIIKRPSYIIPKAPTVLESRFSKWNLRGVRFDLDLVPIDKDAMLKDLDVVKQHIDRLHNWQRLVDELQRVNRYNQEAMLTMENDKSEWEKILKERDDEFNSIVIFNEELEAKIKVLQDELASSSTLQTQREKLLKEQLKEAHDARMTVESKLFVEQELVKTYRNNTVQLREKVSAQDLEILTLKMQLSKAEKERDEAMAGKVVAEKAREEIRAEANSTLFDFYVRSFIERGGLSYLGPKYEITLAEVWEEVLARLQDGRYEEEELISHFLDAEGRAALARGKEQLAKERIKTVVIESSGNG